MAITHPPTYSFTERAIYTQDTTGNVYGLAGSPHFSELPTFSVTGKALLLIHAAHLRITQTRVKDLRVRCPQAKIVVLASDTAHYQHHLGEWEYDSPFDADLHLDTLSEVVSQYCQLGIRADFWMWTISQRTMDALLRYKLPRDSEACCLADMGKTTERKQMKLAFDLAGLRVRTGGGLGEDRLRLYGELARSWVTIGTTSPSWTKERTMKGWRDFAGIALGAPLICDRHPDMVRVFGEQENSPVPYYAYGDWWGLVDLVRELLIFSDKKYKSILAQQQQWLFENTLEKQISRWTSFLTKQD